MLSKRYSALLPAVASAFLLLGTPAVAQTHPTPFAFSTGSGAYTLPAWDATTPAGTYPPNMVFHRFGVQSPGAQEEPAGDWVCGYNLPSRPRVLGKDSLGFSFLNTSSAQYDDCVGGVNSLSTFVGEAVLGLETTNATAVQVRWTGRMWSTLTYQAGQQERVYAIGLQWRAGTSGPFTDVPNALFSSADASGTAYRAQNDAETFNVGLPAAALGLPVVEVRWIYHTTGGTTGSRPELGVDNIAVQATLSPNGLRAANANAPRLRVWPVPADAAHPATVELTLTQPLRTPVEVLTLLGQRVATLTTATLPIGTHRLVLPVGLPVGVYRVRADGASVGVVVE